MNTLNGTNKLILLVVGFIVALLLVYGFALSNTISLWSECKMLSQKIISLEKAPEEIKDYGRRLDEINVLINKKDEKSKNFHEDFLGMVSLYCSLHNIIIKEYPMSHQVENGKYVVETNIIRFEGEFKNLLQLIYILENSKTKGHITSLMFETIPNHRSGIYKLNLTLYEQNIFDSEAIQTALR